MGKYVFRQLMDVEQKTLMRETMTGSTVVLEFNEHFIPKENLIHERLVFNERIQILHETVEKHAARVWLQMILIDSPGLGIESFGRTFLYYFRNI